MLYLDSNIFIDAILNLEAPGNRARSLLSRIQQGKEQALTSALTFDEIVWAVKKHRTLEDAIKAGEAFLNFPNLKLIPVDDEMLLSAINVIRQYRLDPRDAIHAATAITEKAHMISDDPHFDKVNELKRKTP